MKSVEVTTLSSKGQVVIPMEVRREMGLADGAKLMVITDGYNLLLKPIEAPRQEAFRALLKESRQYAKEAGLKKADLSRALKKIRHARRP